MTKLLEEAIIRLRGLPEDTQDAVARVIIGQPEEELGLSDGAILLSILLASIALILFLFPTHVALVHGPVPCTVGIYGTTSCSSWNGTDASTTRLISAYTYGTTTSGGGTVVPPSDVSSPTKH
jgi:hypothetical protein